MAFTRKHSTTPLQRLQLHKENLVLSKFLKLCLYSVSKYLFFVKIPPPPSLGEKGILSNTLKNKSPLTHTQTAFYVSFTEKRAPTSFEKISVFITKIIFYGLSRKFITSFVLADEKKTMKMKKIARYSYIIRTKK